MNIGVFFKHKETGGGIYQYFLLLLEALARPGEEDRVYAFYRWEMPPLTDSVRSCVTPVKLMPGCGIPGEISSGVSADPHVVLWHGDVIRFNAEPLSQELMSEAARHAIDLMLYPTPEREAFEAGIPYVMAVHDVGHKVLPHFPEFTGNGILKQREYVYSEGIGRASFVLVDSETGKKQVCTYYHADPEKIIVLPFVPPPYILEEPLREHEKEWERRKKSLPARFLFYPAQFWPHKNHAIIIKALHLIKEREGVLVPVVFTGLEDHFGCLPGLRSLAQELEVLDQITWLGHLDARYMRLLYRTALALVMPTFLGPTSLPILEAFATGCPVITSDIPGARELVADAALLVDPESAEETASSILRVWTDKTLRETLTRRGRERIAGRTGEIFSSRLIDVINTFRVA